MRSFARWLIVVLAPLLVLVLPRSARAGDCAGPPECCNIDPAQVKVPLPQHVRVGMRLTHVRDVSERSASWSGEIALITRWPAGGLRPELQLRNASDDVANPVDETTLVGEQCIRERRISSTFANWFRLRRFPFDDQVLRILLEERALEDGQAIWEPELWPNIIAIDGYRELTAWRFVDYPRLEVKRSSFSAVPAKPGPRLLIISVPVARLWQFYLSRYFLPLFLIVALAYGLFWIKPEDLGSAASVGITCMLAIIAFQLTQADSLPRVAYLTLADRVYIVCYLATAAALGLVLWESYAAANGRLAAAERLDARMRRFFPVAFFGLVGVAVALGWSSHADDPDADIPHVLPAATPPRGEKAP